MAGILPFILGWLFGSTFKGGDKESNTTYGSTSPEDPKYRALQDQINAYEKTDVELKYKLEQAELALKKCRDRSQSIDMERLMYKEKLTALGALGDSAGDSKNLSLATGAVVASGTIGGDGHDRSGYGAFFASDNLQVVEGVGPKVEALLKENGIGDWSALAAKSPADLKTILAANKLQMMNPDSWPKQAGLAAAGKWDELVEYQKFLDGGRGDTGDFETPAKIDKLAKAGGFVLGATSKTTEDAGIAYGTLFSNDNLQIVEGVGPKVEKLLNANGIANWTALAAKSPADLKTILVANKLQMMNPDTWPKQAELAAAGKWDELIEYQKFLDTGREKSGDFETPAKIEKMAIKLLGFSQNPEDLKIVEGIGPKIETILKDGGIKTWSDLGAASIDRIQELLTAAGDRYKLAKPKTWPKQAQMAADGEWSALKEYQDYLDKGVDPKDK
ncbi:MAG: hypothetical protein Sapg2KO_29060 [Saprospiraceae bacterium]